MREKIRRCLRCPIVVYCDMCACFNVRKNNRVNFRRVESLLRAGRSYFAITAREYIIYISRSALARGQVCAFPGESLSRFTRCVQPVNHRERAAS